MTWIAPAEKDGRTVFLEKRLWDAADQFRANPGLNAQGYSGPIPGIIFLCFAEVRFTARRAKLENPAVPPRRGSIFDDPAADPAEGILYLAPDTRFDIFQTAEAPRALLGSLSAIAATSLRLICKLHLLIQNLLRTRDQPQPRLLPEQFTLAEN